MPLLFLQPVTTLGRTLGAALCLALLSGCQSLSSTGSSARVRVINLSPNAPPLDIYQGTSGIAYNLGFGTVTSYVAVAPGISAIAIDTAGSKQVLATVEGTFSAGMYYTVLLNNPVATLRPAILADHPLPPGSRLSSAPSGPSVRLVHQASSMGPVDVYLVPSGQRLTSVAALATNLTLGINTSYLPVPACTCAAVVVPAGLLPSAGTTIFSGTETEYTGVAARTLILLDAPAGAPNSAARVLAAVDAESTN